MLKTVAGFDWDEGNKAKCQKHGVSVAEIEVALSARSRVAPDLRHSDFEQRFIAVERNYAGRPMFIAFTFREVGTQLFIRPISARYMHNREIEKYEKSSNTSH